MKNEIESLKKKLNEEYLNVFQDIEYRISTEFYNNYKLKEVKKDILGMFIENQERGFKVEEVLGKDLENFCIEILKDNKANPFIIGLEFVLMMISIFSFMALLSVGYSILLGGYQNLYYDSVKEITIVHYIPRDFTLMLKKSFITEVPIVGLIIVLVNIFIWKNTFKFKSFRRVKIISLFIISIGAMILGRILKDNSKTLDNFVEVKIFSIGIIFIVTSLMYFGVCKYRSRRLI